MWATDVPSAACLPSLQAPAATLASDGNIRNPELPSMLLLVMSAPTVLLMTHQVSSNCCRAYLRLCAVKKASVLSPGRIVTYC